MRGKKMTLVPEGGLGNRMKAIASAYALCKAGNWQLQVVWFRDKGLNARFSEIFEPVTGDSFFHIREANLADKFVNALPRPRNLRMTPFIQQLVYDKCLYANDIMDMVKTHYNFNDLLKDESVNSVYLTCYRNFGHFHSQLYNELFHPCKHVMEQVNHNLRQFSDYTIGMHIRRTDHAVSIKNSPTYLFINKAEEELQAHPDLKIFLATDSDEVKHEFLAHFGSKIITATAKASRDSTKGILDGLTDMWTLSKTKLIYGSIGSTFSQLASLTGGIRLISLKRTNHDLHQD